MQCVAHFFILLVHKKMHVLALEQSTTIQYALGAESAATYKEKHWRLNSAQEVMNKVGLSYQADLFLNLLLIIFHRMKQPADPGKHSLPFLPLIFTFSPREHKLSANLHFL